MVRNQFTFYKSFLASARKLKKSSDREKFLMAVIEYALEGKEPVNLPENCDVAFSIVRPVLDSSRKKAENASKGGYASNKQDEANGSKPKQTEANGSKPKQTEANGSKPKQTEANRKQEKGQEQEQVKGQEKEQVQEQLEQTATSGILRELWGAYPGNRRDSFADVAKAVAELNLTGNDIYTAWINLSLWKRSMEWTKDNGQYIPGLIRWLESGKWVSPPPPAQLTSNPFVAMAMEEGCYDQG